MKLACGMRAFRLDGVRFFSHANMTSQGPNMIAARGRQGEAEGRCSRSVKGPSLVDRKDQRRGSAKEELKDRV